MTTASSNTRGRFHGLATKVGLGGIAAQAWHRPRAYLRQTWLEGGPIEQFRTREGQRAMLAAAHTLPELVKPNDSYPVAPKFLSGSRFWYQTLFCIVSLQTNLPKRIDPIIFDDGTLDKDTRDAILKVIPWARFRLKDALIEQIERRLPERRYPTLRARRIVYPHLRKLTDLHDPHEWSLVLDSDMLFFRRPKLLEDWLERPEGMLHIVDAERSYGYSDDLMRSLARGPLPDRMNVGLYGIHADWLDLEYLEHCCKEMILRERANYLQEQAMTALLASGLATVELPREDYVVRPTIVEGRSPTAVLHHYVAHSKRSYFQYCWRRFSYDFQD